VIRGLGIDVVSVDRMRSWVENEALLARFFHPNERVAVSARGSAAVLSLAARFAAKEAFGKALGTGLRGLSLRDIEVRNDELGKPELLAHAKAASALRTRGIDTVWLSLTHERENAIAVVVLEGSG